MAEQSDLNEQTASCWLMKTAESGQHFRNKSDRNDSSLQGRRISSCSGEVAREPSADLLNVNGSRAPPNTEEPLRLTWATACLPRDGAPSRCLHPNSKYCLKAGNHDNKLFASFATCLHTTRVTLPDSVLPVYRQTLSSDIFDFIYSL